MIPELPAAYVEHLVAPRHLGDLEDAQAAGEVGSMVGGMAVRVTLTWRCGRQREARIQRAAARVLGSLGPVAPASWTLARVVDATPEEAAALGVDEVLAALGATPTRPLPHAVVKGAGFVIEALRAALGVGGGRPADPTGPGLLVCRCLGVGDRDVRAAVRAGADSPEAVGDLCRAGQGCRSCRPDLEWILHEETAPAPAPPPTAGRVLARIAWAHVAPALAAHGQVVRDVTVTGDGVHLVVAAGRPDPSISPRGAQAIANHVLREVTGADLGVSVEAAAP